MIETGTAILLLLIYAFIYVLVYKIDFNFTMLLYLGLGITTFALDVYPAISWVLTILPLVILLANWLNSPKKRKN